MNPRAWKSIFIYREGEIFWRYDRSQKTRAGDLASGLNGNGKASVSLNGKSYSISRVIYEMHNGQIPNGTIVEHINGNTKDNRVENLRLRKLISRGKRGLRKAMSETPNSRANPATIVDLQHGNIHETIRNLGENLSISTQAGLTKEEADSLMIRYIKNGCFTQMIFSQETNSWTVSVVLGENLYFPKSNVGAVKFETLTGEHVKR